MEVMKGAKSLAHEEVKAARCRPGVAAGLGPPAANGRAA
jgi:hypothetical protein